MGATAAWLYGIGEVSPSPYEFCTPERKQTKRPNLIHQEAPPRPEGRGDRLGHPGDEALAHGGGPDRLRGGTEPGRERARGRARKGPRRRRGRTEGENRRRGAKAGMPAGASLYDSLARRREE